MVEVSGDQVLLAGLDLVRRTDFDPTHALSVRSVECFCDCAECLTVTVHRHETERDSVSTHAGGGVCLNKSGHKSIKPVIPSQKNDPFPFVTAALYWFAWIVLE